METGYGHGSNVLLLLLPTSFFGFRSVSECFFSLFLPEVPDVYLLLRGIFIFRLRRTYLFSRSIGQEALVCSGHANILKHGQHQGREVILSG